MDKTSSSKYQQGDVVKKDGKEVEVLEVSMKGGKYLYKLEGEKDEIPETMLKSAGSRESRIAMRVAGRSFTPRYVVKMSDFQVFPGRAFMTHSEWKSNYGRPTPQNIKRYVETYNASLEPDGANSHIGREGAVYGARVVDQTTGEIVAEWFDRSLPSFYKSRPMFEVVSKVAKSVKAFAPSFDSPQDFTEYLRFTLIPDLKVSGSTATAADFAQIARVIDTKRSPGSFPSYLRNLSRDLRRSGMSATADDIDEGIYWMTGGLKVAKSVKVFATNGYQTLISSILRSMGRANVDPRHVEAYMRLEQPSGTLDHLSRHQFARIVPVIVEAIDADLQAAEQLADSYGL